ncbi:hypothetical protein EOPP23_16260 [Endozoicomonas sp. OPT23]|uniref:hypothetical protein n=1 Tax=Endozoicomonas sp. OPT23 TaxID=2072845 RepID=UPI00129C0819|nr:hypothetical protein [Endozoicomonas sp. OPT23]MRI34541.1 hypothetical protein [Endozoicomonas sp. OPT23]
MTHPEQFLTQILDQRGVNWHKPEQQNTNHPCYLLQREQERLFLCLLPMTSIFPTANDEESLTHYTTDSDEINQLLHSALKNLSQIDSKSHPWLAAFYESKRLIDPEYNSNHNTLEHLLKADGTFVQIGSHENWTNIQEFDRLSGLIDLEEEIITVYHHPDTCYPLIQSSLLHRFYHHYVPTRIGNELHWRKVSI